MSQPQLEPGHVVAARYRIDKAIGKGGFGTVYRATRLEDNLGVALKLMHEKHVANPEKIKRFQREAALVTRLHHQNVVDTLDYGHTDEGLPFIIFELLRGHSLKYRLTNEGALSLTRTCQISIQVLRALEAAHALEIAHRDIKPANIYLCAGREEDFVKVLDFGIAKALGDKAPSATQLTRVGQMLGTPAYMSPEQIRSSDNIGLTCDLYSLGLVMSELLSGRKLIRGANEQMAFLAHLSAESHELSEAVAATPLARIIARAVEKDPSQRFASATEMLAAVEAVAAAERFGSASLIPSSEVAPPSELSQLKATLRTAEADAPPSSSLAGLQHTMRTSDADGVPPSLADLQQTVRIDPELSVDEILRQHGIELPPLDRAKTTVAHTEAIETVSDEEDARAAGRHALAQRLRSPGGPTQPLTTSPSVPPAALPSMPPSAGTPFAPPSLDATKLAPRGKPRMIGWLVTALVLITAAAASLAYWFLRPPPSP